MIVSHEQKVGPMNVADLLTRQALATPDQTAVIHGDQIFSYVEFEALVCGLSAHFLDSGLKQGEIVGLYLEDPLLHLSAIWALARIGAVAVAVSSEGAVFDAGKIVLSRAQATALVTAVGSPDWKLAKTVWLSRNQLAMLTAGSHAQSSSCQVPDQKLHLKTSSGTTAIPKIAAATHAGMIASIEREIASVGYLPGERYMTPVSLTFDGPRRRYMACLASGGTAVLPPVGGGLQALIDTINRNDVQHFSSVSSQAHELALGLPPQGPYFPRMRCFRLSAGPSDVSLHQLLRERVSANVLVSYGCTELGPLTVAPPDVLLSQAPTVGRPMQGVTVQIVSEEGQLLPAGVAGLIRLRAEGMPHEYHDDPVATAKFFRDGWFYPGDLGRMSEGGLLAHLGRADEMMVMDGINIYPAEIEQALMSHSAVRDAVAFPMADPVVNDVPFCAVSLLEGKRATERDLLEFARGSLGSHGPQGVAVLDVIPRNEHGKVQRSILMQSVKAWIDARQNQLSPAPQQFDTPPGQLAMVVRFGFPLPEGLDFKRLDAWLVGVLLLPVQDQSQAGDLPKADRNSVALAWLERLLLLSRLLLQGARIPVLDTPQVIECHAELSGSDRWMARANFARVEELPLAAYDIALKGAVKLCAWAMLRSPDPEHLQQFYTLLERDVVARLQTLWQVGKSTLPILQAAHKRSIRLRILAQASFSWAGGKRRG